MRQNGEGLLLVVSGPAGVGKGTINNALMKRNPNIKMSVSATTRAPREGEIDGVHYFFKSEDVFREMIAQNDFLEYMHLFQMHYSGTPKSFVVDELALGNSVLLEIDVQGAMKVKQAYPEAVLVFLAPPSMSELKSRLIGRGTESIEAIERRFAIAFSEVQMVDKYDYIVVNNIAEVCVAQMEAIIAAEKCKITRNKETVSKLLKGI